MPMDIRLEREDERQAVEELTRDAFWDLYAPGASEHCIVHALRQSKAFIPELNSVAVKDGRVVGHIMYTRSIVRDALGTAHDVTSFGPLSVLPALQGRGIGSALIRHTQKLAADMGFRATVIYGHPDYYGRFDFVCGKRHGICAGDGRFLKALLVREHYAGALRDISGAFYEDSAFSVAPADLEAFDARFPFREKTVTESQKEFALLASALA